MKLMKTYYRTEYTGIGQFVEQLLGMGDFVLVRRVSESEREQMGDELGWKQWRIDVQIEGEGVGSEA